MTSRVGRVWWRGALTGLATAAVAAGIVGGVVVTDRASSPSQGGLASYPRQPLAGRTVVIDAGHQLGNRNFPEEISRPVPAGGLRKPCNTVGTATRSGLPESTFNFAVARLVRRQLVDLGARVLMTRTANREDLWGPCVDARGRAGNRVGADAKVSIHADGASSGRGFHVIAPTDRPRWTRDIYRPSRRLAWELRAALDARRLPRANYVAGGDGLGFRGDLATLNLSDVPTVLVEFGNMRDRVDARRMSTREGRRLYAAAVVAALRRHLAG